MDLFEAIKKRATYRGPYKSDTIPKEHMQTIMDAAINAPSGKNMQTTTFVVVDDPLIMKKLAIIIPKGGMDTAPCAIVCVSDTTPSYHDNSFYKEDYSAAVMSIYLAATALGYATCWLDGVLRLNNVHNQISRLLNIPEELTTCVLLPIGIPAREIVTKEKKPINERVCYNAYSL